MEFSCICLEFPEFYSPVCISTVSLGPWDSPSLQTCCVSSDILITLLLRGGFGFHLLLVFLLHQRSDHSCLPAAWCIIEVWADFFFLSETLSGGLFFKFHLFIWAVLGLRCCRGLSLGGWAGLLCRGARTPPCSSLSLCRVRAPGAWACEVVAHRLGAPRHVGSSQTRDGTYVPCIGRWILSHWTTREVPPEGCC